MAAQLSKKGIFALLTSVVHVSAQVCYYGPGEAHRGPSNLVPCTNNGQSSCCLLGDTCYSGGVCYNYPTGDLYQYGCTDETYTDPSCPFKCGWNETKSPWTALEYCDDLSGVSDTWVCQSPESCGCEWEPTYSLLKLAPRQCKEMGSDARVALYGPNNLAPYVSLPTTLGGSTGYYQTTTISGTATWISTVVNGYTPSSVGPFRTYTAPNKIVQLDPNGTPSPSTLPAAVTLSATYDPTPNTVITYIPSSSSSSSNPTTSVTTISGSTTSPSTTSGSTGSSKTGSAPTMSTTNTPPPPGGLSTGAKAGIGVGVAGGVCLLAAAALVFFVMRKRKNRDQVANQAPHDDVAYDDDKHASWESQGPNQSLYDPHYSGNSAMVHEAAYSQRDEESIRKHMSPPAHELDAGFSASEMESRSPSQQPNSPVPPKGSPSGVDRD